MDITEKDLLCNLEARCQVIGVKRFLKKQLDGSLQPLRTILITFLSTTRPDHVTYDNIWFDVREYVRPLLQCFNCYKFNHGSGSCKNIQICSICSQNHNYRDCPNKNNVKCSNCSGPHVAISNACPVKSSKIAEIKNRIAGNFTYATVASKNPKTNFPPLPNLNFSNRLPLSVPQSKSSPQRRANITEILNSDIILNAITKTIIDIMQKKEEEGFNISSKTIKESLIANFV